MKRRNFIQTTGISLASIIVGTNPGHAVHVVTGRDLSLQLINFPDEVSAVVNNETVKLVGKNNQIWTHKDLTVFLKEKSKSISVAVQALNISLSSVTLFWKTPIESASNILNDQWERTYGDISWHKQNATEILPWYFMEHNEKGTNGFGIKTGAASFCFWQLSQGKLSLTLDMRSGGNGVQLGDRKLEAAEIVTIKSKAHETPFQTTRRFTKLMCNAARMPKKPVYGINDWYFSYGNNSEKLILEHTALMSPFAEGLDNRPFSVIDAGWFKSPPNLPNDCCFGDDMKTPNSKFGDMSKLAEKIRKLGLRPGIWTRPLCASYRDDNNLLLPYIKGRTEKNPILDPTLSENLERLKNYFKLYNDWGYEMVKFDFTIYDILGKWGFEMLRDKTMTESNWRMNDISKTNAEIILNLYKTIRTAAGATYIISCNTISHLCAGIFELNRIGDDTSGQEWERTRKMGVNTLAFRSLQHGTFYACDGDCLGLTTKISWARNKQWLELVAKSGTPLFISAQAEAVGPEQKIAIKEAFKLASQNLPVAEPLDWMENSFPKKWKLNGRIENFDWN